MKRITFAALILPFIALADNAGSMHISQLNVNKGEDQLTVNMMVDPRGYHLKGDEIVNITPLLVGSADTIEFPTMRMAGRRAWYAEVRDHKATPLTLTRAGKGDIIAYSATQPVSDAFDRSQIVLRLDTTNVCNCRPPKSGTLPLADLDFTPFEPQLAYHYLAPAEKAEKIFNLSGRANIIFKVNRTEIDWSYAGNRAELDTILRTINAVKDNKDATVEAIYLTGYASPEGSYANNVRLAKGRTEVVKEYVMNHASFPASIYHTSYVPEDWEGLREWIAGSSMPERDQLLEFIDDKSIAIEKKNDLLKARFPKIYPVLLAEVYPQLRHTDYKITYRIRQYLDVNEIREVMRTNPRNLSLDELFLLANSCTPGSEEYDEVFSLAARLYPDNLTANLNAANSAMNRGQYAEAARFLDRAGDTPETEYARGILAIKTGDLETAEQMLNLARQHGITDAEAALQEIERYRSYTGNIIIL